MLQKKYFADTEDTHYNNIKVSQQNENADKNNSSDSVINHDDRN